jgi:hypothetical protein
MCGFLSLASNDDSGTLEAEWRFAKVRAAEVI